MTDTLRRTEYLPLAAIEPALANPKLHALDEIKRSLRRFGYADQAVLDERTGRLIAGHGRIAALRQLEADGEPPPPGITLADGGGWMVPVTRGWASRDDAEAHALGLALNRLTERGGWDRTQLADMLESFALAGPEAFDGTGFTTTDLDDMLAELAPKDPTPPTPPPPAERTTQGLREVNLVLTADDHRAWTEAVAKLRRLWRVDEVPAIALRAVLNAADES